MGTKSALIQKLAKNKQAKVAMDITERRWAGEAIKRRLAFEETIAHISSRFVGFSNIDGAINDSLADVGTLSQASRAYIFLFREEGTMMDNTHEWCAEGMSPQMANLQNLPCDMFLRWMTKLRNGEVIHIKDVSKMPAEAKNAKEILESQDLKSLLVLPLYIGGEPAGFLGLDNAAKTGKGSH